MGCFLNGLSKPSLYVKKHPVQLNGVLFLAEKEGFEPSIPFWGIHDFQSCALGQLRDFSIARSFNRLSILLHFHSFVKSYLTVFVQFLDNV